MILVVGGTGRLGGQIVRKLLHRGKSVRIFVRSDSDYEPLVKAGAKPVFGDLKEPVTLVDAMRGVSTVITTANSLLRGGLDDVQNVDLIGNRHLINTTRSTGVKRFIFVSDRMADEKSRSGFLHAKMRTEQHLIHSGLQHTILAFEPYTDLWLDLVVRPAVERSRPVVLVGCGEAKHSFISLEDAAEFTVAAVDDPRSAGQYLAFGGPQACSWNELVAMCSKRLGGPLAVEHRPLDAAFPEYTEPVLEYLASMEQADSRLDSSALANRFKVRQTPIEEQVSTALAQMKVKVAAPRSH